MKDNVIVIYKKHEDMHQKVEDLKIEKDHTWDVKSQKLTTIDYVYYFIKDYDYLCNNILGSRFQGAIFLEGSYDSKVITSVLSSIRPRGL